MKEAGMFCKKSRVLTAPFYYVSVSILRQHVEKASLPLLHLFAIEKLVSRCFARTKERLKHWSIG
jgi:hypothetical protein